MNYTPVTIRPLLIRLVERFRAILGERLVGVYLHGSTTMGCFNPQRSDIDFIVVVTDKLDTETKRAIIAFTLELARDAPPKGLEFSVVKLEMTQHFVYPTPFELHYSRAWHDMYQTGRANYESQQTDADLAAHFMIIGRRGICLVGRPISQVFTEVPDTYYWASILSDAQDILNDIALNPVYGVLNLCRVLAFKEDKLIASKAEGGQWGLMHLAPEYHELIRQALNEYEGPNLTEGHWDQTQLECFGAYIQKML